MRLAVADVLSFRAWPLRDKCLGLINRVWIQRLAGFGGFTTWSFREGLSLIEHLAVMGFPTVRGLRPRFYEI